MNLKYVAVIILSFAAVCADYLFAPTILYTHAAEPPVAETNAPGESNCTSCHSGTITLNSSSISVSATPTDIFTSGYIGGKVYAITFTLANTDKDYGFEMTCLNSSNDAAGTFAITNTTTTSLQTSGGRQYIGHKNADATFSWTYNWTAPAKGTGTVTFYSTGLLGNGNGNDQGDLTQAKVFAVNEITCNLTASISSSNVSCYGGDNGSATATPGNGTSPYAYTWSDGAGNDSIVTGLSEGAISVTVTDANTCTATASTTITQPSALTATTSFTDPTCGMDNGSASVTPSGGTTSYKYAWSTNPVQTTLEASGIGPGTYTVTITDANSCSLTKSVTVTNSGTLPDSITSITGSTIICPGTDAYGVTPSNGTTYVWALSGGGILSAGAGSGISVTWDTSGSHTLSVTPSNSCGSGPTSTLSVTVKNAAPSVAPIITGDTIPCLNQFTYGISPQAVITYAWALSGGGNIISSNDSSATVNWNTIGTHTVSVTPSNSCGSGPAGTLVVTVNNNVPSTPVITGNDTVCAGTSPGYTIVEQNSVAYHWSLSGGGTLSADTGSNVSVAWNAQGSYTISVVPSDICGTGDTGTLVVVVGSGSSSAGPVAGDTSVCINTNQTYSINLGNANAYNWSVSGGGSIMPNAAGDSATITWTTAGTYNITVDPMISCGYGTPGTLSVTVNGPPPAPVINGQDSICANVGDTFSVVTTTGETYTWNASGGATITAQDSLATIVWASAGDQYVSASASNTCGTSIPDTQSVEVLTAPESPEVFGPDSICYGNAAAFSVTPQVGATYIWSASDSGSVYFNYSSADISWSAVGRYSVSVTSANSCGNSSPQVQPVTVFQAPPINIGNDTSVCGIEYTLIAPGYETYLWSTSSTTDSTFIGESGTYSVTVTTDSGCITSGSRYITFGYILPPSLPDSIAGCGTVTIDPGSLYDAYAWSNGTTTEDLTTTQSGAYTVTVSAGNCQVSQTVLVRIDEEPLAGFTFSVNDLTVTFTDTSTDGVIYRWDFGDGDTSSAVNPVHVYAAPALYHVILTIVNACDSNSYLRAVDLDTTTGINAINNDRYIEVYPNPVTDKLVIVSNITGDMEMLNETGQDVFNSKVEDSQPLPVDMSNMAHGLYLVRITNGEQTVTKKVVKL